MFHVSGLQRPPLPELGLSLPAARLVCLSGPSGAGKSLLLRALADLDVNNADIVLDRQQRDDMAATEWRRRVAYLPAESRWWAARVGDHFRAADEALLQALGFSAATLDWQVERLSSGERQRLALARVLENRPRVLLLDEPTANLDPANTRIVERIVSDYIRDNDAACLWVTHDREQIQRIADRQLRMDDRGLHPEAAQ